MKFYITISLLFLFIPGSSKGAACSDSLLFRVLGIERKVMYAESETVKASWLMKKALLYKEAGHYDDALTSLQRIDVNALEPARKDSVSYEKAFNLFMLGTFPVALQELWSMQDVRHYSDAAAMLYLMVLLENQHWDEFKQEFLRSANERNIDTTAFLTAFTPPLMLDADRYDRLAKIPGLGLGLIKAGYTGRGLTSASLQLLLTGAGIWQVATGYYFTGIFSGLLPARRFYNGGKILTASMVARTNEKRIADVKRTGYSFISKLE